MNLSKIPKNFYTIVAYFYSMFDIAFPKNKKDQDQFSDMAKTLGVKDLCFLSTDKKSDILLADVKQISSFKKSKLIFAKGCREAIEAGAHVLFDFEIDKRDDFLHHRASGLNQVLCNIAKRKNSIIAFNFNSILNADDGFKAKIIGRIQQNIKLCRKYKVSMLPLSFAADTFELRSPTDFKAFFIDIGMHPKEIIDGQKKFKELLDKFRKTL